MANRIEQILVPEIGGATDVEVIEVFVKPGDTVAEEGSLITLEGDKATMEVPSPFTGTIKDVQVSVGDKVSEGSHIVTIEVSEAAAPEKAAEKPAVAEAPAVEKAPAEKPAPKKSVESVQEVRVPEIGDATDVEVIEIIASVGAHINADDSVVTLEGDKASMDVPSPFEGEVTDIKLKVGDKVSAGDLILLMKAKSTAADVTPAEKSPPVSAPPVEEKAPVKQAVEKPQESVGLAVHAGPAVRRIAREFGVDLTKVKATGDKGLILKEDVQQYVKGRLSAPETASAGGLAIAPMPTIDFSKFGEVENQSLSKIKKMTGVVMARNWATIPHVTQFGEADVTELEAFRKSQKQIAEKQGVKLTPLVFIMKAVVAALKEYPQFNSSLAPNGEELILKKYFHIGVAVDTPNGLVVPVIRDVDKKGLFDLAKELGEISVKARDKGLGLSDMQGGCFTISSLGGIGGTAFTPIINAPEVAILGVSRNQWKPVCKDQNDCKTRLMLPLCLSYDHRVIDGADGARFTVYLANRLADIRMLLL